MPRLQSSIHYFGPLLQFVFPASCHTQHSTNLTFPPTRFFMSWCYASKISSDSSMTCGHRSIPPPPVVHRVDSSTQTSDSDLAPQPCDLHSLTTNVRANQHSDKDISMLKFLIDQDIQLDAHEIQRFAPSMRRYLWQLPRFELHDDLLYQTYSYQPVSSFWFYLCSL